ncbi:polysaccharide lyase family 7 protein [Psychromonas sp. KJ10-10]|uniref:polysaccharide lyase family 7 protein n=1 Tax=Psychromonas sp. KJ10-10 TaxID=3391823 RepID=UPI0039B53526
MNQANHDGNGPDRLYDNDIKTRWSANGESWATLDYGKVTTFDAIRASFHKGDQRSTKFNIEVSKDGKTWQEVLVDVASSGEVLGYERFEFKKPVQARYVKYVGKGNTSNTWNSVTELAGLNCEINDCPVEHIITADVIANAKAKAEKAKAIKHVGKVTTLDNWKLTIPATNESFYASSVKGKDATKYFTMQGTKAESVAEILPGNCSLDKSSLNTDVKNPYFWADAKGWHFRTPLVGGTTTPNSTYIRSELRELGNKWKPCDESPKANWGYGGDHILTATLTLDEIPANPLKKDGKTPDAPKVVLGQIHAKDVHVATVKLLWEGSKKPVRVILNKSTEKSAFSVKLGKIADPSKPWSYMIKMTDKGIELVAGGVTKKLTFGKELDSAWKKEKFYFKAGLYPQIYKSSGGAFEATFSKLSILHTERPGDFGTHVPLICDPAVSDCSCVVSRC